MMQPKSKIYDSFQAFSQTYQFDFTDKDSKLGNGSYGEVIMGEKIRQESDDSQLPERWVAIKRSFSENDRSIEREYEAARDLSHPNVMRYLAYGRLTAPHVGTRDYLVMPFHPDGNLHQFIRYNTLTSVQTRSLVMGILEGLAYLHSQKRQHRDLKGSNILIGRDPKTNEVVPIIADFGSTKMVMQSNSESFSQSEHAKTIANAAPEQILGESSVNYNVDLWAFGVIVYEIMTGQHPFNYGLDELEPTTARNTLTKRIVTAALPEKTKKIAEPYQTMIRRCLVVDRKKRVQKAEELLKILDTYKVPEPGTDPVEDGNAAVAKKKIYPLGVYGGIAALVLLLVSVFMYIKTETITFGNARDFSDGLAAVETSEVIRGESKSKWGYIDKMGQMVIEPQFDQASEFSEGVSAVGSQNGFYTGTLGEKLPNYKWKYIDKTGQVIIESQFDGASKFSEGLAAVKIGEKWGYIDKKGKWVIQPQYELASEFSEGLACIGQGYWYNSEGLGKPQKVRQYKWGYINRTGKIIIEPQFREAYNFSEGLAVTNNPALFGGYFTYIDKTGQVAIDPEVMSGVFYSKNAGDFKDGLACIYTDDEKFRYINQRGQVVIPSQYENASDFSDGLASVKKGDSWGFIDKTGKMVIQPQFRSNENLYFHEGLCRISPPFKSDLYINKEGQCVINCP